MFTSALILPFLWAVAQAGCPCVFNGEAAEVVCDQGTQSGLYWGLPDCLSYVDDNEVKSTLFVKSSYSQNQIKR